LVLEGWGCKKGKEIRKNPLHSWKLGAIKPLSQSTTYYVVFTPFANQILIGDLYGKNTTQPCEP
jgi:hypothetical protein